jgi:tetratricopeptide (TPR) repeat protein/SAM-dependent methyltransferase
MSRIRAVLRVNAKRGVAALAKPLLPRLGYKPARALLAVSHRAAGGPRGRGVLLREAERRVAAGDLVGGCALLRAVAAGDVSAVRTVLAPLDRLRAAGGAELAVELWRELAVRDDLSEQLRWRTRHGLGRALADLGRTEEAVQHLRAAVEAVPDRSAWRHELLILAARSGAIGTVAAVLRPGSLEGLKPAQVDELLEVFEVEGILSEAVAALADGAVAADVLPLVRSADRTGIEKVVELLADALPDPTDRARVWDASGRLHGRAKRWSAAAEAYERAIEAAPDDATVARRLGTARRRADLAVQGSPDAPSTEATRTMAPDRGEVTLEGGVLVGTLPPTAVRGAEVRVKVNGRVVARTHAAAPADGDGPSTFRRAVRDLWYFAGHGDVVEVEHDGRPLPFADGDEAFVVTDQRPSAVLGLFARLDDGHVLNKYGKLRRSIKVDERWQADVLDLFERLRADLREAGGVELFPFYGTMLGAVREQHFLGHDNDFDAVYVSDRRDPAEVKGEFLDLCSHLVERGYEVQVRAWHAWVHGPRRNVRVDLFFGWFDEDDRFQVSYGYHGEPVRRSEAFSTWREGQLGRHRIPVPANAEQLLEQLYGPGWRDPDPGFSHYADTRRLDPDYRLTTDERNRIYWRQFYRDHQIEGGSSFANFVFQRFPEPRQVIELGCGTGRDSVFLAGRGHRVVAADRSPEAIERGREARAHAAVDGLDFAVVDASDRAQLASFLTGIPAAAGAELLVYLRFFLHSIPEAVEDIIFGALTDLLPAGFRVCAEFRTAEDERRAKVFGDHYRRYLDEEAFVTKLSERWGFEIEHLEAGTGLSPYQGEDPHLARVIARLPA